MPLYDIVRVDPRTLREAVLGRVRARTQPGAVLAGLAKYRVSDVAEQRQVTARPVRKTAAPEPLPDRDAAAARQAVRSLTAGLKD